MGPNREPCHYCTSIGWPSTPSNELIGTPIASLYMCLGVSPDAVFKLLVRTGPFRTPPWRLFAARSWDETAHEGEWWLRPA